MTDRLLEVQMVLGLEDAVEVLAELERANLLRQRRMVPPLASYERAATELRRQIALTRLGAACGPKAGQIVAAGAELLTTSDASALLGVDPRTVRKRVRRGVYPGATRHGRDWLIPLTEIERGAA